MDRRWSALAGASAALAAALWLSQQGLQLLYADARSHQTIARRLIDGPNPGLVQLGTVWLPLQHLLLAPLAALDPLWTSGWSGALLGAACLAVEAAALWHVTTVLNDRARLAGVLVLVLYLTNPTILYLHTSAFAEPVLYAALLLATAGLVHWATRAKPYSGGEMALYCGAPAALAVLARYDGWAFAGVWAVCVAVLTWRRWGSARYAAKLTACFALPSLGAALWWLWFNWVNFGDPLGFQRGPYSAQVQQDVLDRQGLLPDQGDLARSVATFARSAWVAVGWITLVAAAAGAVVVSVRLRRRRGEASALPRVFVFVLVLTVTPAVFYVWSLVTGQIALRFGDGAGESIFNLRYGAAVIPGLAILAASALAAVGGVGAARRQRDAGGSDGVGDDAVTGDGPGHEPGEVDRDQPADTEGVDAHTNRADHGAGHPSRWRRVVAVALALTPVVALALVPGWRHVGVVREGLEQRAAGDDLWDAAEWLGDHRDGGSVLIDDSVNPMLPIIGAPLDDVVAPFTSTWDATLADPSRVTFVFVDRDNPDDQIARALADDASYLDGFDLVEEAGSVGVYQRREEDAP